jgi:MerR family copper efflux transcriptional regulator
MTDTSRLQIGEVAAQTGLSVRTIRHYEDVGLVTPSARSIGGFRLYSPADVARLTVVRGMKPLGFTLEEMADLLSAVDTTQEPDSDPAALERSRTVIEHFHQMAMARVTRARRDLEQAEMFVTDLQHHLSPPTMVD